MSQNSISTLDPSISDYRALYYRWEQEHWSATAIDLSEDRLMWGRDLSAVDRDVIETMAVSFSIGAEQIAGSLVPFVDAAPSEEQHVFLTTQLVDGARHVVFFDRILTDVVETERRAAVGTGTLNDGYRTLLFDLLPESTDRMRREPRDLVAFYSGVVLLHLVIEGAVILTNLKLLSGHLSSKAALPGVREGFGMVARDLTRHVDFAVASLTEAVTTDGEHADVIEETLAAALPVVRTAFDAPQAHLGSFEDLPYGPDEARNYSLEWVGKRLRRIGVDLPT